MLESEVVESSNSFYCLNGKEIIINVMDVIVVNLVLRKNGMVVLGNYLLLNIGK